MHALNDHRSGQVIAICPYSMTPPKRLLALSLFAIAVGLSGCTTPVAVVGGAGSFEPRRAPRDSVLIAEILTLEALRKEIVSRPLRGTRIGAPFPVLGRRGE